MARLYPKVDAFRILKTTEGIDSVGSMLALFTAILCFLLRVPPLESGVVILGTALAGDFMMLRGLFIVPGLVGLGTIYSYLAGFGVYLAAGIVVGFFTLGWRGALVYPLAAVCLQIGHFALDGVITRRTLKMSGLVMTASERHFINAYRLHAQRIGETTDIGLPDWELEEENWAPVFEDLSMKWPRVVERFTPD